MIGEDWLRAAARRPSDNENAKRDNTERQIREALAAYKPLHGRPYRVYAKGSYANNTNVRLNFDVDIAVEYYGYFYSELAFELKDRPDSAVGIVTSSDPYTRAEFKNDISVALKTAYGSSAITPGRIAYRVRENKTTLPADVVPSWEYRRYDGFDIYGQPIVHVGSRVYPSDGGYINNFPKVQVEKGTAKNNRTGRRYKRMVRCLKKVQMLLIDDGTLKEELPSYLIECVVYNVPDVRFADESYLTNFRGVVSYLWGETRETGNWNDWHELHELMYLFRGGRDWTPTQVHTLASRAWDAVGVE